MNELMLFLFLMRKIIRPKNKIFERFFGLIKLPLIFKF